MASSSRALLPTLELCSQQYGCGSLLQNIPTSLTMILSSRTDPCHHSFFRDGVQHSLTRRPEHRPNTFLSTYPSSSKHKLPPIPPGSSRQTEIPRAFGNLLHQTSTRNVVSPKIQQSMQKPKKPADHNASVSNNNAMHASAVMSRNLPPPRDPFPPLSETLQMRL